MADKPIDPTTLQELLQRHKEEKDAIRSEFEERESGSDSVTEQNARKRITELAPQALNNMRVLLNTADSESVRWNISKYVMDVTMGKVKPNDPDSVIKDLIESLKTKPVDEATTTE